MQREIRRPFTLYNNCPAPIKVYLWVYKVPTFLYKPLRIALETQVDGVCSTRLALTCLRSLEQLSVLSANCRWHHAGRKLHPSCHRPSGWGNSAL